MVPELGKGIPVDSENSIKEKERHNKDFENALKDLNRSCELGNKHACKRYNGLEKKI